MLKGARGRRGFTLIETVVTVGIVATLAAVVVPQVVKQFDAADPARIQNDLKNIQTAVETFAVNMSGTLPGDLDDLVNPVTTDPDITVGGAPDTTLTSAGLASSFVTSNWNGPYVDFSLVESGTDVTKPTGYSATIHDTFVCFNATDNVEANNGSAANQACATGVDAGDRLFLAIRITGLGTNTGANFIALNDMFDGTSAAEAAARATLGRVRWVNVGGTTPTAYYFVAALN